MPSARQLTRALKTRIMLRSRRSKIEHFHSLFTPGMTVLDVGVTAKDEASSSGPKNYLLKTYPYAPETYTGLGVHDLSALQKAHPRMRFVRYDGRIMPFEDGEFDWVFSNAVIEHVGDRSAQLLFLNEMLRVARYVFFTTPNKHFPIETHTSMPFLHWNDRLFDKWLWKYKAEWRSKTSLWLLSTADVRELLRQSTAIDYTLRHNRALLWPMTMTIVASRVAKVPRPVKSPNGEVGRRIDRPGARLSGSRDPAEDDKARLARRSIEST